MANSTEEKNGNGNGFKFTVTAFTLTLITMVAAASIGWGQITAKQEMTMRVLEEKANKETFEMYMKQTEGVLRSMDKRLEDIQKEMKERNRQ
jgi:hypothetical protein